MTWINSDDKYHPNVLDQVAQSFLLNPFVAWVTGIPSGWNEDGSASWVLSRIPLYSRKSWAFTSYRDPWIIQQEGVFWSRNLWNIAGGHLDTKWKFAADVDLWRRFFRYAQLYSLNTVISGSRLRDDQFTPLCKRGYIKDANAIIQEEIDLYHKGVFLACAPAPAPILFDKSGLAIEKIREEKSPSSSQQIAPAGLLPLTNQTPRFSI